MAVATMDLSSLPERPPGTSAGMIGLSEPAVAHVADSLLLIEQSCTTTSVQVSSCCNPVLLSGQGLARCLAWTTALLPHCHLQRVF